MADLRHNEGHANCFANSDPSRLFASMTRLALQLAYDGGDFSGFAALPGRRTVQGEFERVLAKLLDRPCPLVCAGRTDAGVHAYGQLVSFETTAGLPPETL
ncbi:MAG: tRNA pseudouridine(38-40) synthase TruA, partial [Candidatus Melainabacteria bacterium HGW-Melainabacteria-1]